ncbi:hypothetical protein DFH09DRAFT_1329595 [Mycena vulgaris]|nr:hypothetical protein DFH09DRAFT_1329595 [Mycena vulgaris]
MSVASLVVVIDQSSTCLDPLRRTLRSGKEFSAFDMALGHAIAPPTPFDVGQRLRERLAEQDASGIFDEDETVAPPPPQPSPSVQAPEPRPAPATASACTSPPPASTSLERSKVKSKARHDRKREEARAASDNPTLKGVHRKRLDEAKAFVLELDVDAAALPQSKPAWTGSCSAGEDDFTFTEAAAPHDLSTGLGGTSYSQAEVDALSGTEGFMYIAWLGLLTIPPLDSHRRIIALLRGMPRDDRATRIRLTEEQLHHRCALDLFPAVARRWSHDGGQIEPGELCNNVANTKVTDELMAHEFFQCLAEFANLLFVVWAPLLFAYYQLNMTLLAGWKPTMRRNFAKSIFAACTFNFGPRAICAPHLDFANLSWWWCAISALGDFNPDLGGHLILWDLCLVIRFPPGSTILLPSALIRHSNVPIRPHEHRSSFVQYTAGGLFRWVRNGFKTDEDWDWSALRKEREERDSESKKRWERGMKMFSVVDDL